jgi:hypothetical protein
MRHSFGKAKELHQYMIGATALNLACKTTDHYRRLNDLVDACRLVSNPPRGWATGHPKPRYSEQDKEAESWREKILFHEEMVCSALCFDFVVELPHQPVMQLLKHYSGEYRCFPLFCFPYHFWRWHTWI